MLKKLLFLSVALLLIGSCGGGASAPVSEATVTSVSKTSVTDTTGGSIKITYTFSGALSSAPAMIVTSDSDESIGTPSCDLAEDGLQAECTVSGISGCTTYEDYTATLSGGVEEYAFTFNSADDEFDSNETITNCWTKREGSSGTASATDGLLTITVPGGTDPEEEPGHIQLKSIESATDIAVLIYYSELIVPEIEGWDANSDAEAGFVGGSDYNVLIGVQDGGGSHNWYSDYSANYQDSDEEAIPFGDLAPTSDTIQDFYVCMVRNENTIKAYISFDGENFKQLTHLNMECDEDEPCTVFTDEFESYPDAEEAQYTALAIGNATNDPAQNVIGKFGPVRFKTNGITGASSADCPNIEF